ncbi:MAG: M23 family metallopeptidase [Candidatus Andeanibacterium colombiense]|uniref:M23 family metallopeptidase n=1 Tax=Candidatus Andeanibacterium colombiense TaxID=3121345 RepID=A0AAJ5X7G6_9SPHN|nr:MAG: M23 family metallopeptidase [Sphingomonadaceae bacterium]
MLPVLAGACSQAVLLPAPAPPPPVHTPASAPAPAPVPLAAGAIDYRGEVTQGGWIRGTLPAGTIGATLDGAPFQFASDLQFFAAFDRDAGPVAKLVALRSDGSSIERDIPVSPRDWQIERVNVARLPGGPSADFMKIRQPELDQIEAARKMQTDAQGWRQHFVWPVKARVSGRFGSQRIYKGGEAGAYHSGMDLAGGAGTVFVAPADGVVILAAATPFSLEGNLLMIDHGNGLNSAFLHCSEILVRVGDHVRQGQPIGKIGMTGRATGPHLHWSLKWNSARLDPLLFTGPME